MSERSSRQYPLELWQAETLRVTWFSMTPSPGVDQSWWSDIVGQPPDSRNIYPKSMAVQEEGTLAYGKLILRIEQGRIDWILTPTDSQLADEQVLSTLGPLPQCLQFFRSLIAKWIGGEMCPAIHRLAFGAMLIQPVKDLQAAHQCLMHYLPDMR